MWVGGVKLYVVGFTAYQISKILFIIFANYYRTYAGQVKKPRRVWDMASDGMTTTATAPQ